MKVAIIGCGLIGGSIGLTLKGQDGEWEITGIEKDMDRLHKALKCGAVDHITTDLKEGVKDVDLVIIAAPVRVILKITPQLNPFLRKGVVITDVGSTKEEIVYTLTSALKEGVSFVGAHPMAGGESHGIEAARGDLFCGAVCVITPIPETDKKAISLVRSMWEGMGARVIQMSPSLHDRIVGLTSHLPHIVAVELVRLVSEEDKVQKETSSLIGRGFLDMTRIAKSSPDMWRDICLTNKMVLLSLLERFKKRLDHISFLIKEGIEVELWNEFAKARNWRDRFS